MWRLRFHRVFLPFFRSTVLIFLLFEFFCSLQQHYRGNRPLAQDLQSRLIKKTQSQPLWLINNPAFRARGELTKTKKLSPFKSIQHSHKGDQLASWDDEAYLAINNFFWGLSGGIVLEMGALDGMQYSGSREFVQFGWHRVLIEGSPRYWALSSNSPDASYIGAAICDQDYVHYVQRSNTDGAINGVLEFMTPGFIKEMHPSVWHQVQNSEPEVLSFDDVEGGVDSIVTKVPCVTISQVVEELKIKRVSLFILDVEGGELSVLKTIDFSNIHIDVLCIEVDEPRRPKHFRKNITNLLLSQGFLFDFLRGRNAWFHHQSYKPSVRKL